MNIALIAHDARKELMASFCARHSELLKKHKLCATGGTASAIKDHTTLNINEELSGKLGGGKLVAEQIRNHEIHMVILFRTSKLDVLNTQQAPITNTDGSPNDDSLILMACESNNVPIAFNVPTANALMYALASDDAFFTNNQ